MGNTPQLLKGFRDFLPSEKRARDYVAGKVMDIFELFGFEPLETPTLEYASLLLGKYGVEADKLVYTFTDRGDRRVGLRYDQTVPTARVLTQYQNELPKYFRRYQIQNVFRADKPQKGRYREFTQCDIDIFGSVSPIADAEILACTYFAYKNVGFPEVQLIINDRQVLIAALSPFVTEDTDIFSIIQSIDKLDKLTDNQVEAELIGKGLTPENAQAALHAIGEAVMSPDLEKIITNTIDLGVPVEALNYQSTLARGLDYYTGMIFEVKIPLESFAVGSFGGGGRYDNLIRDLGGPAVPAVGVAFGFDRMVEAAKQLKIIPLSGHSTQLLVSIFDGPSVRTSLPLAKKLREAGFATEVFPGTGKLDKQFKYADQKHIPLVLLQGPDEIDKGIVTIKDLRVGKQKQIPEDHLVSAVTELLS